MLVQNGILDSHGYTHSIDMVTIDYMLVLNYKAVTDKLMNLLSRFGFNCDKDAKLDMLPSFRYEYYTNHVWFNGIIFSLGKWTNYDKADKTWYSIDMMRLKVNPNKHAGTPVFDAVLAFLGEYCRDGYLLRYDYAVDIPCDIGDLLVISSRKEKGLYRGTRYFGQRHKHGYLKIYDKAKEQHLETSLTRVEYTFCPDDVPSWDNIIIRAPVASLEGVSGLSAQLRLYLDMLTELRELGADIDSYIERMTYRSWKQIEPYLFSGVRLELDELILDKLVKQIDDMFIISHADKKVKDFASDDFIECFDTDLPFD